MVGIIAIVLVMFIINSFMVYAIIRCWERVNDKIKKFFLDKSSNFDIPIVNNEDSVCVKNNTDKVVIKEKPVYVVATDNNASTYKNNFKDDYKRIKEQMSFDKDEILNKVVDINIFESNNVSKAIVDLCNQFDFNTVYELSTLEPRLQEKVLKESLNDNQRYFLDEYLKNKIGEFNSIDFYDYIKQIAKKEDPNFYVKTGWKNDNFDDDEKKIVTIHDDEITEGIKILHKDKLYDYSV